MSWTFHLLKAVACALILGVPGVALAHAMPQKSQPAAGATVAEPPAEIKVWFNSELSPQFDQLTVKDGSGNIVSRGEARVDQKDPSLLEVDVPKLPPGTYHVYWRVASKDGHRTEGDYTFTVSAD